MTYLSGDVLIGPSHRIYERFLDMNILIASVGVAFEFKRRGRVDHAPGDNWAFQSHQFDLEAKLPIFGPIELCLEGKRPDLTGFGLSHSARATGTLVTPDSISVGRVT